MTPTRKLQQAHSLLMAGNETHRRPIDRRLLVLVFLLALIALLAWQRWSPEGKRVFPKEYKANLDVKIEHKRPPKTGWMLIELTNPPKGYGRWRKKSDHIVDQDEDVVLPGEGAYFITCSLQNPPVKPKSLQATASLPPSQRTYGKDITVTISAEAIEIDYSESDIIDTFLKPRL